MRLKAARCVELSKTRLAQSARCPRFGVAGRTMLTVTMHYENPLIPSLEAAVVAEESRTLSSLLGGLDSPGGVPRDVMKLYLEPAGTLCLPEVPPSTERGGPD